MRVFSQDERYLHQGDLKKDVLIVGHGLAGAILAQTFLMHGVRAKVCEAGLPFAASSVAAGLVNPLIGPKLNPPGDIRPCLGAIAEINEFLRQTTGHEIYEDIQLLRVFKSQEQADLWHAKRGTIAPFSASDGYDENFVRRSFEVPFGYGMTKCLRLKVGAFLACSKHLLQAHDCWIEEPYSLGVGSFAKTIFCEGFRVHQNPWFSNLPFAPVRGEVIKVNQALPMPASNGTWAIPDNRSSFAAGSTWDHEILETGPTREGINQIIRELSFLKLKDMKSAKQFSGVRTGTIDRQPIIGPHPKRSDLFVFNGFGSRGSSTIPFYAAKLVKFILEDSPLPGNANVSRFKGIEFFKQ